MDDRILYIELKEVHYFESAANYIIVHTAKENHIVRKTLTDFECALPKYFQRISRSIIVNLNDVRELHPAPKGEFYAVLKNNTRLAMTRNIQEAQKRLQYF